MFYDWPKSLDFEIVPVIVTSRAKGDSKQQGEGIWSREHSF